MQRGCGLVLVASYGGSQTWRALTYHNGKAKTTKLGTYPGTTVKQARALAREYWQDAQKFPATTATGSFGEVADEWFRRHVVANKLRSADEMRRILDANVLPKWKDLPFLQIRRAQVNELLDDIADLWSPALVLVFGAPYFATVGGGGFGTAVRSRIFQVPASRTYTAVQLPSILIAPL